MLCLAWFIVWSIHYHIFSHQGGLTLQLSGLSENQPRLLAQLLAEFSSFAKALKLILSKLNKLGLSYNYFCHQVISDKDQHFYLKIQPRDSIWAGVELGSGLVINSISPETAAKFYRK